jgi:MFS family permease
MMGLFLILPVFMVLARDIPGFTPFSAGIAVGAYGLTQAILQQPFGWLSDRWGRRPVMLLGLALFAIGSVLAALSDSMHMLIAGRALQGCGAIAGVAMALAADVTRPERRPLVMAVIGIGIGGAFLLSMVLSVPLSTVLGLHGLFWLTVAFAVAGMVLIATVPNVPAAHHEASAPDDVDMRPVWILSLSVFLLHCLMTLFFVTLPPMLVSHFGFPLQSHWKVYVPTMLLAVAFMMPILRVVGKNLSEHRLLPRAFVALALAMALLPFSGYWAALGLCVTVYFVGFNLLEAAMPALLSRLTGSRGRGRRMGMYSTFQFLGAFTGGVAGGWVSGHFGARVAMLGAGAVCLLWAGLLRAMSRSFFPTGVGG